MTTLEFYATSHFTNKNDLPLERVEYMLENAFVIKDRMPLSAPGSLLKAAAESGNKIYAYYRSKKKKSVIVLGRDLKTQKYNVLITIFRTDSPGWISKKFRMIPKRKRQYLTQFLSFNKAQINRPNPKPEQRQEQGQPYDQPQHVILTAREFGYKLERD